MKQSVILISVTAMLYAMVFSACDSPAQRVENAKENVTDAKNKLDLANQDYLLDIESYKKVTTEKIAANDQRIASLKQKTTDLEKSNSDMKKKMDDYKGSGKEDWQTFKTQFNTDMDALGQRLNDITTNNK